MAQARNAFKIATRKVFETLRLRAERSSRVKEVTCTEEINMIAEVYSAIVCPKSALRKCLTDHIVGKALHDHDVETALLWMANERGGAGEVKMLDIRTMTFK